MNGRTILSLFILSPLHFSPAYSVEDTFCTEPEKCVDDKMKIVFRETGTSELGIVTVGQELEVEVLFDVRSEGILGWTYGIGHDPEVLEIVDLTDAIYFITWRFRDGPPPPPPFPECGNDITEDGISCTSYTCP